MGQPVKPLTHLQQLEAESIQIFREVAAEFDNPVMLYSIGKDSSVLLHLARKAFYPGKIPFPLLHVDTRWKFREMIEFRDKVAKQYGFDLLVHINPEGIAMDMNPFTYGSSKHTDVMKTQGLKQALDQYGFDAASVYCATKFAVEGFTESLALEVKGLGIEVNIVEPGFFRTDFLDSSSVQYGTEKVADYQDYSTALEQAYSKVSHQQAGDPAKLGKVLVQLAKTDILPLRYAAGSDAIDYLTTAYQRRLQELNDYKALSMSTDLEA